MCGRTAACVCITCLLPIASVAHAANDARLAEAVKQRDREAVHALLGDKADVNAPLGDGATALHWAAQWDDLETADLLIRAGARVNATDDYGVTPLWLASTNGNAHIVEKLLQVGADPNATLPTGATVLMTASRTGKADAVQLLLEHGAAVSATEHAHGQTALMWAAAEGHAEAARALIAHGADVHAQSTAGYTPLLLSARNRSLDAARVLLDAGADVNQAAPDGTTALVVATIRSRTTLARFLLEHGADANAGPGFTPLHWAAGEWNQQVTGRMGLRDEDSEWSITGGLRGEAQLEFVKVLLSHGANPNARATSNPRVVGPRPQSKPRVVRPRPGRTSRRGETTAGATPFWIAAKAGDVDVMRLLLVSGADPSLANRSVTPLMAAAGVGAGTGSSPVPQSRALEAVKLCLALGNDINATTDENGETALHGAAYRGPQGTDLLIQFLVDNGASMNVKNALGWTPLTIVEGLYFTATNTYSASGAELLRTLGADPSPANIDRQVGTTVGPTRANR